MGEAEGENDTVLGGKQSKEAFQDQQENFGRGPHLERQRETWVREPQGEAGERES